METIKTELLNARSPDEAAAAVPRAAALLREGKLVAFPTETVYGLGADATNPIAVARIFAAKGRPTFDPLIVHIADRSELPRVLSSSALSDPRVSALADAFWPGPLTIVAPASTAIPELVRAGLPSVGVRLPAHETARTDSRSWEPDCGAERQPLRSTLPHQRRARGGAVERADRCDRCCRTIERWG